MYSLCSQHMQSFNFCATKFLCSTAAQRYVPDAPLALQADLDLPLSRHSSDLNSPDFYLWGYFKVRVYEHNLQTIPDLKAAIRAERGEQEGHWELCQANPSLPATRGVNLEQIFERLQNKEFLLYRIQTLQMLATYIGCT